MTTKKLLSAAESDRRGGFLYPFVKDDAVFLADLKTGKKYEKGMVTFIGVEINVDEFLKKVYPKNVILPDEAFRNLISTYFQQLQSFKIGNIIGVRKEKYVTGFQLYKIADMESKANTRLP